MLYNLIVINAEAGINICTLQLAEEGITEDDGQLASGMVKAIRDILEELKVGEIKNFETHQRQVLMYKKDAILTALICDQEDNIEIYNPKIQKITEMFNNVIDWNSWGGEMDIFEETIKKAKKMITLSNDEILNLLEEKLNQLLVQNSEILGYKIIFNSKVVSEEKLDDIEDFEIKSLLDSNFYNMIKNSLQELEISFVNTLDIDVKKQFFVDYKKLSILIKYFLKNLQVILILPGLLDPLLDLPKYEKKLETIGGF